MSFHLPHPRPRQRHKVITPAGDPVPPRDAAFFRALHPTEAATAQHPAADPAHVPTGAERRSVALAMRVPQRPAGPPRTRNGIRIVSSFFADPDFAEPLERFMADVHRKSRMMAHLFDKHAARIEHEHDLGTHFAAARQDGHALAAAYAQGGTETMVGLAAQVRARIVADALSGGAQ